MEEKIKKKGKQLCALSFFAGAFLALQGIRGFYLIIGGVIITSVLLIALIFDNSSEE